MRYSHRSKQGIFSRFIRGLAGLIALLSKDNLASGDKGYECRIIGPRCRPQDSQVWPYPPSLLCPAEVGSRTCGYELNRTRFTSQRTHSNSKWCVWKSNRATAGHRYGQLSRSEEHTSE